MSTTATPAPAWAHGYALEYLRGIRQVFTEHDAGLPLGAFTAVKENHIAGWLHTGELVSRLGQPEDPEDGPSYLVARRVGQRQTVLGWNGEPVVQLQPGDLHVKRMAWAGGGWHAVLAYLRHKVHHLQPGQVVLIESWTEHPGERQLLQQAGALRIGTKIRASSELFSLWLLEPGPLTREVWAVDAAESRALSQLGIEPVPGVVLDAVRAELAEAGFGWADHYSSYNQKHSWSAVGLTSYTPPGAEPSHDRIEKPAEMSRAWKAEHPDWPEWQLQRTPLADQLPFTSRLLETLPGEARPHRVRLMRLTPGGGELTRHSDITDPDAGTREGQYMRLHLPLITNPEVIFQQWLLDGRLVRGHMPEGRWWYIDTRKPHTARNGGASDRIHLVADVAATDELRRALLEGEQAEVVPAE